MLSLKELIDNTKSCEVCWNFSDQNPCPICSDKKRDLTTLCIVTEPQDLEVIEETGTFQGRYHVLRDLIDVGDEESFQRIKSKELLERLKNPKNAPVKEVILALNPDLPGETTMMYLEKELKKVNPKLKVTRLARGLPLGADLRYADEITLGSAIKNRTEK